MSRIRSVRSVPQAFFSRMMIRGRHARALPNVVLMRGMKIMGEEIFDREKLKELKESRNVMLVGSFALYTDRIPELPLMVQEPPLLVFHPSPVPRSKGSTKSTM